MLKIETDGERMRTLEAEGSPMAIAAEIVAAMACIYETLKRSHEDAAETFKAAMRFGAADESPAWKGVWKGEGTGIVIARPQKETE